MKPYMFSGKKQVYMKNINSYKNNNNYNILTFL